jgi:hypothetical protein
MKRMHNHKEVLIILKFLNIYLLVKFSCHISLLKLKVTEVLLETLQEVYHKILIRNQWYSLIGSN